MTIAAVTLLGASGSIGASTLDVIERNPERYRVFALTANRNWQRLLELAQRCRPQVLVCVDDDAAQMLSQSLKATDLDCQVYSGCAALERVAGDEKTDIVMTGIVGAAGLLPSLAAVKAGKRVLLANKESLVMAGGLFMRAVATHRALLLPVDSEHNALFQCLPNHHHEVGKVINWREMGIDKLVLTASGGPFLSEPLNSLADKTPQQAVAHPNWRMGRKISVDSATLMNKGLEVIEASYLYGIGIEHIEVVVHPQSIIHSMVTYRDGSVLAEAGNPDMRTPIAHALAWPERVNSGVAPLDLVAIGKLEFQLPDRQRFPCLGLAFKALERGGTAPAILNAANEVAVAAFLNTELGFGQIFEVIRDVVEHTDVTAAERLQQILDADTQAREVARDFVLRATP